jgi:hypothetical protein
MFPVKIDPASPRVAVDVAGAPLVMRIRAGGTV